MEQLLAQVPELQKKLKKRVDIRTTHFKDLEVNPMAIVGQVVKYESWVDDTGYQWTRADVMLYIKMHGITINQLEQINEKEPSYVY